MQGPAWAEFAGADIREADKNTLTDIAGIELDTSIPQGQRGKYLTEKLKNPYCFKAGDVAVKLEFTPNAPALQTCLIELLNRKKSGLKCSDMI